MVSIVIPLYNKELSIASTLDSISQQTYKDFEVFVVNDGSTDQSRLVVEEWMKNHSLAISLINKENGGVCSARNRGIQEARGEYIALLDGDDLWDKEFLAEIVKMQHDFPEAAMWGINFAEMSDGKLVRKLATGLPEGYRGYVDNYFELTHQGRVSDLFCSSSVVIRRDVFEKVGYFDERLKYAEDTDMWWRIIARNRVAFYDRYMCFYQFDAENRAMQRRRALRYYLPFYIAKYQTYKDNHVFYRFANRWAAVKLRGEYFGKDNENVKDAAIAIRYLDYSVIPAKYRLFYQLPYRLGYWISELDYKRVGR